MSVEGDRGLSFIHSCFRFTFRQQDSYGTKIRTNNFKINVQIGCLIIIEMIDAFFIFSFIAQFILLEVKHDGDII